MFNFILRENNNAHSLLYLGGVSSVNLEFLLDYIYHGEISLFQHQLDSFLESAQQLEIDGLIGQERIKQETHKNVEQAEQKVFHADEVVEIYSEEVDTSRQNSVPSTSDLTMIDVKSLTFREIQQKIKELYKRVDEWWICMACDYRTRSKVSSNIKKHVEIHFDGLSYSCNQCNKEYRSSNSLYLHRHNVHKSKL